MPPKKRLRTNQGLPKRWRLYHGAYYYRVPPGQEHLWDGKKQFRLGSTLPEAHRVWAERMEHDGGELQLIGQLLDRYAMEVLPAKAAKTQREQTRFLAKLKAVLGHMHIKAFKPMHAYGYRDRRGKQAPTAANRELEVLSHAFTKAIEWGALEQHPMIEGKFKKLSRPPRTHYVTDDDVLAALSLDSKRKRGSVRMVQAYIKLKLLTGMRRTDLLLLRTTEIKEDGIHVTPSKTKDSSGKSTIYEWDDEGLLRAVIAECKAARPVDISPFLFCNAKGKSYVDEEKGTVNGWDSMWGRFMTRVVKETGIERFQERDLRAKAATDADSLEQARALLSHASAQTTKRIYVRKPERVKPGKGVR